MDRRFLSIGFLFLEAAEVGDDLPDLVSGEILLVGGHHVFDALERDVIHMAIRLRLGLWSGEIRGRHVPIAPSAWSVTKAGGAGHALIGRRIVECFALGNGRCVRWVEGILEPLELLGKVFTEGMDSVRVWSTRAGRR